jgi:alkylated DNA repair dioxygenase AlkB
VRRRNGVKMPRSTASPPSGQAELFEHAHVPDIAGLRYEGEFLGAAEEQALLALVRGFALEKAQYRQWQAHRRVISFGGKYDFDRNDLLPADPIPQSLHALRARIAAWCGLDASRFTHALVAEYRPGTQLGWHRDMPHFEVVVGVSLAGPARLRFRPYPPQSEARRSTLVLDLAPRSIYTLQGHARWQWQHAVSPTKSLRYAITFRTLSAAGERRHGTR